MTKNLWLTGGTELGDRTVLLDDEAPSVYEVSALTVAVCPYCNKLALIAEATCVFSTKSFIDALNITSPQLAGDREGDGYTTCCECGEAFPQDQPLTCCVGDKATAYLSRTYAEPVAS